MASPRFPRAINALIVAESARPAAPMPLSFALDLGEVVECGVCEEEPTTRRRIPHMTTAELDFGMGRPTDLRGLQLLLNVATTPVLPPPPKLPTAEAKADKCEDADEQYSVSDDQNVFWAVLFAHRAKNRPKNSLLGEFGHLERSSAWSHLLGAVGFGIYAIVRGALLGPDDGLSHMLAVAAAGAAAFCFAASTIYHVTSPRESWAVWTRQADYLGIYLLVAVSYVADMSIATSSFANLRAESMLDVPIAAVLILAFFLVRRLLTPTDDTWVDVMRSRCSISFGLFRKQHFDGQHSSTRQASSFVICVAYFVSAPSLFATLGTPHAEVILSLEVAAFVLIVAGMALDNSFVQPDASMIAGRCHGCCSSKYFGCIMNSHALWHVLALIAAIKSAAAREVALVWLR